MIQKLLAGSFSLAILCCSCNSHKGPVEIDEVLPGFTLIAAPNELDKPGVIFAVDAKGVMQPLGILNNVGTQSGAAVVGQLKGTKKSSFSALLGFLAGKKATINAGGNMDKDISYDLQLSGCTEERLDLMKLNKELQEALNSILELGKTIDMTDYKFFVITDAVKAKKLTYTFSSKDSKKLEIKANIEKIADLNPGVKWNQTSDFDLSYDLDSPLYVYAKYWDLVIKKEQASGQIKVTVDTQANRMEPIYKRVDVSKHGAQSPFIKDGRLRVLNVRKTDTTKQTIMQKVLLKYN